MRKADLGESVQLWELLVETVCSIVSAVTEDAGFTGLVKQMPFGNEGQRQYPRGTGYGNLGKALKVGDEVEAVAEGDRVLSFSNHASAVKAEA